MPNRLSFMKTFRALENALGIAEQRQKLIASNISNLDTPDYKAKEIDFKSALAKATEPDHGIQLKRTDPGHILLGESKGYGIDPHEERGEWNGYNWVHVDREMTKLMESNLRYRATADILLKKIAILKEVIQEGGR